MLNLLSLRSISSAFKSTSRSYVWVPLGASESTFSAIQMAPNNANTVWLIVVTISLPRGRSSRFALWMNSVTSDTCSSTSDAMSASNDDESVICSSVPHWKCKRSFNKGSNRSRCITAEVTAFELASNPSTLAPSRASGCDKRPPPQPTSSNRSPDSGWCAETSDDLSSSRWSRMSGTRKRFMARNGFIMELAYQFCAGSSEQRSNLFTSNRSAVDDEVHSLWHILHVFSLPNKFRFDIIFRRNVVNTWNLSGKSKQHDRIRIQNSNQAPNSHTSHLTVFRKRWWMTNVIGTAIRRSAVVTRPYMRVHPPTHFAFTFRVHFWLFSVNINLIALNNLIHSWF